MPYGDIDRVSIGSGNGLLPDGTKSITWTSVYLLWHLPESSFTMRAQSTILYNEFENYILQKLLPHLPGQQLQRQQQILLQI